MIANAGMRSKVRHASEEQQPLEDAYADENMNEEEEHTPMDTERELTSSELAARAHIEGASELLNPPEMQGELSTLRFKESALAPPPRYRSDLLTAPQWDDDEQKTRTRRDDGEFVRPTPKSNNADWDDDLGIGRPAPSRGLVPPQALQGLDNDDEFLSSTMRL
jgi:hypothetical protein